MRQLLQRSWCRARWGGRGLLHDRKTVQAVEDAVAFCSTEVAIDSEETDAPP